MTIALIEKISMFIYFENLFVEVLVLYVLNIHIKFHVNQTLFTIQSINLFLIHNFRLQKFEI